MNFSDILEAYDFLKLPQAEALVPLNPQRWPAHAAGSILTGKAESPYAVDLLKKPFSNLIDSKNYLMSSHNRTHFYSRAGEVVKDTMRVNGLCEAGGLQGSTASGAYANWATNKYKIKMQVDLDRLPDNETVFTRQRKKDIRHNTQQKARATNKAVAKMNPTIGNASGSPTVSQFARNNTRSLWSRKFFDFRGGSQSQAFIIEVPTNQTHLLGQQEVINYDYYGVLISVILIFVILTKKTFYRFRKIREKLSRIFNKVKMKIKRKPI